MKPDDTDNPKRAKRVHPWVLALSKLISTQWAAQHPHGTIKDLYQRVQARVKAHCGQNQAIDQKTDPTYNTFNRYVNIESEVTSGASDVTQGIPWAIALGTLVELGLSNLTVADLASYDLTIAKESHSSWSPGSGKDQQLRLYLDAMQQAQRDDEHKQYRIFGLAVTFWVMSSEMCEAYCRHMYGCLYKAVESQNQPRPSVDVVVASYELMREQIRKRRADYGPGTFPRVKNYIPESSFRELLNPNSSCFGDRRARIEMLEYAVSCIEQENTEEAYSLYTVDEFALLAEPRLLELIDNSETVICVGEAKPNANDVNCGAVCSRRERDFSIRWSTSRSSVNRAAELFRRLDALNPTPVKLQGLKTALKTLKRQRR